MTSVQNSDRHGALNGLGTQLWPTRGAEWIFRCLDYYDDNFPSSLAAASSPPLTTEAQWRQGFDDHNVEKHDDKKFIVLDALAFKLSVSEWESAFYLQTFSQYSQQSLQSLHSLQSLQSLQYLESLQSLQSLHFPQSPQSYSLNKFY